MKRLTFPRRAIRAEKLIHELVDGLSLEPWLDENSNPQAPVSLWVFDTEVIIEIVDSADESRVAEIYNAHDPTTLLPEEEAAEALRQNETTIRDQASTALSSLQAMIDKPNGEWTNADAIVAIKDLARIEKGIIRILLSRYEAVG